MTPVDNLPGGEDYEDYKRDDLSGFVVDVRGDMVTVRFVAHGLMTCRLVTRIDGSLAIDPSGIPKSRQGRIDPMAEERARIAKRMSERGLPAPGEEIE